MVNERLRRVTDLFVEGTELFFGFDEQQQPILMWVNKLNSFETEEARRDAMVKRGMRVGELSDPKNPEFIAMKVAIEGWNDQKLAEKRVEQMSEEIYLEALNDIESEEAWRDKIETVRRGTTLLDDEGAPEDDPRRAQVTQIQVEYINKVREVQEKVTQDRLAEVKENSRTTNMEEYLEQWRNRVSLDIFMAERRVSELFAALRDCKGKPTTTGEEGLSFDHSECDHSIKMMKTRAEVYALPESIIERAGDALDGITVDMRTAGNSVAPESSSASSEQPSAEAEASTPSIPEETPLAVPTT